MKRVFLALALAVPTVGAAQIVMVSSTPDARPISLAEAVKLAQQNAPQTVQARGALRTTAAATRAAIGAFTPSVTATMGGANTVGQVISPAGVIGPYTGQPWNSTVGLTATLPLFTGLTRLGQLRGARADEGAADANELAVRYNVAFQVKQQYFAALAAREAMAAARAQLDAADQQFRAAVARVQAGAATKSDSLRSVITVGNAKLALLTARNNVRNANAALTRLVQSPVPVTPITADTADPVLVTLDSAALEGLAEDGPAVRTSRAQLTSSQAAARVALGGYLPSLSLSYGTTGNNPQSSFTPLGAAAYQNVLRLQLSYTLFNGFTREQGVVNTRVAEENASAQLRDALFLARQNFAQQLGLLRTAEQQIAIQHASVEAADEDLRVQTQRYTLGASTLLDVLTSQTALNQARAALIQARFDYRNAKAQLEQLVGRDL